VTGNNPAFFPFVPWDYLFSTVRVFEDFFVVKSKGQPQKASHKLND
jgi:hypothetical protein